MQSNFRTFIALERNLMTIYSYSLFYPWVTTHLLCCLNIFLSVYIGFFWGVFYISIIIVCVLCKAVERVKRNFRSFSISYRGVIFYSLASVRILYHLHFFFYIPYDLGQLSNLFSVSFTIKWE